MVYIPVPVGKCHHNIQRGQGEGQVKETVVISHSCALIIINTLDFHPVFIICSISTLRIL